MSDCVRRQSSRFLFVLGAGGLAIGAVACSVNLVPLGTSDDFGDSGIFAGNDTSDAGSGGGQPTVTNGIGTTEDAGSDASSGSTVFNVPGATNVACQGSTTICEGTCYGAKCVDIFGSGASSLETFTLRGGYLYAANDSGGIMKMPIDGSAGTAVYTPGDAGAGEVQALTSDANNLYFVDGVLNVWQMPIAGGTPILLASNGSSVAVDATSVFWVTVDTQAVMKAPIGGGTAVNVDAGGYDVSDIVSDGTSVYWTTTHGDLYKYANGNPSVLVSNLIPNGTPYVRLAANAGVVAWSTFTSTGSGNDQVGVVAADGTATLISNAQSYVDALALDASYVYWGNGDGDASLHRARIGTTSVELEAAGQGDIRTLAVDGTSLYYLDAADITVLSPK